MSFGKTLNPASLKYNYMGEWNPNKVYHKNDICRFSGRTWYCKVDNHQGYGGYSTRPDKDGEMWAVHGGHQVIRGGWSPHFQYFEGDVVSYQGDWFICEATKPKVGSHPIYKNGSLTNEWTRMTASPKRDQSLYTPHFTNWSPMGWTKYGHPCKNGIGQGQTHFPHTGVVLLNHGGDLQRFGKNNSSNHDGFGSATGAYFNMKVNIATPTHWEYTYRSKNGIYNNHPNIVQWNVGREGVSVLYDNGEMFVQSNNDQQQGGFGAHTEGSRMYLQRIGVRDDNTPWTSGISNTILNSFIVKFAGGQLGRTGSGTTAALDSDGNVWTWGENNYGGLGDGDHDGTDNGLPTKINPDLFGGAAIVDIFSHNDSGQNDGATYFYAIDENGMMWGWGGSPERMGAGWGENSRFRSPNPISDFGKYGGIKEVIMGGAAYGGDFIITEDGTAHYSGRQDYMFHNSEIGFTNLKSSETFIPMTDHLFNMHKARNGRFSRTNDNGISIWGDVETLWDIGRRASGWVLKTKDTGDLYALPGNHYGHGFNAIRGADGDMVDGTFSSSMYYHIDGGLPNIPLRIDTLGGNVGNAQDVVHIASSDQGDSADASLAHTSAILTSEGKCVVTQDDAESAGLGNNDMNSNELSHTANFRPGEFNSNLDTANQTRHVRGGQGSMNNIAVMGVTSTYDYSSDVTTYKSVLRIESDGSAWVTGEIHRTIEEADVFQFPKGTTPVAENEDASLFGSFRLK